MDDERGPLLTGAGRAVRRVDGFTVEVPGLALEAGAAIAVVGPSGVGKSTLLRGLFGLHGGAIVDWHGTRTFAGAGWPARGTRLHRERLWRDVCVLPQDARAALDPLERLGRQVRAVSPGDEPPAAALAALGIADAGALLERFPHEVSGGQAQAVLLAIAARRAARLLVADEPTVGLDDARAEEVVRRLAAFGRQGSALLVATHDARLVDALGAARWAIHAGRLEVAAAADEAWPSRGHAGAGADAPPVLRAAGVAVRFGARTVFEDVDLELRPGEAVALVGVPGAGKSTLARVLAGHLRPARGRVERAGGRAAVQLVFQDAYGSLTPGRSARAQIEELAAPGFAVEAEARAVGLDPAVLARVPADLSGGERRRVALLRALSVRPAVLVLDEPTAELDRRTAVEVVRTLLACQRRTGVAMLWITHDRELAAAVADRIVSMERGRTCSLSPQP